TGVQTCGLPIWGFAPMIKAKPAKTAAKSAAEALKSAAVTAKERAVPGARPQKAMKIRAFQIGLLGGLGVLLAVLIGSIVSQLSTVLVYTGLALFLSLGLDPLVSLIERKLPRAASIAVVVVGAILAFGGILFAIVPILIEQTTNLIAK